MGKLSSIVLALAGILTLFPAVFAAQTFSTLVNFDGTDGKQPIWTSLIQGPDANIYGTTHYGGNSDCIDQSGCGTVFKVSPSGDLTDLYLFCGSGDDCGGGFYPYGGLLLATDGNLYGTTTDGGDYRGGTVFRITPEGSFATVYNFCSLPHCADGGGPEGPLIQGEDGNLYGTTYDGGTSTNCYGSGCGTVFKVTPQGLLTTLHSFDNGDGAYPMAGLVQATDGNFYGTTLHGGHYANDSGTIFRVRPTGEFRILHLFCKVYPQCADGSQPFGGLIQGTDGNLYGTTSRGGARDRGVVFQVSLEGKFTNLHSFVGTDGEEPEAGLAQGTDGKLYGTTTAGGDIGCDMEYGCGTLFSITSKGELTSLHSFNIADGYTPSSTLFQATNGVFYGSTYEGGSNPCGGAGCGTVFGLDVGLAPFVSLVGQEAKVGSGEGILGQGFTGATKVSFHGTHADFKVVSDTLIKASVPSGATTGYVTVSTPSGTLKSNKRFRVTPQLLSFDPPSGPVGTQVTITGVSLTQTQGVGFGDQIPAQFTVNSDTQVTAIVPAGAKTGPIGIQTLGGKAISSTVFTVTQ